MAVSLGFSCSLSGNVTLDEYFVPVGVSQIITSSYISVGNTAGVIVYQNGTGNAQVWPNGFVGYNPIAATKILTSAVIDEVEYTTTATGLAWHASPTP